MEIYVDENYNEYKYLVSVSDNYIVLSDEKNIYGDWQNPEEYNVIYQFIKPSTYVIETTRTTNQNLHFEEIETTDEYWNRGDACEITLTTFAVFFIILFYVNMVTRLFKKGGMFFGS